MSIDPTEHGRDNHAISRDHYRINPGVPQRGRRPAGRRHRHVGARRAASSCRTQSAGAAGADACRGRLRLHVRRIVPVRRGQLRPGGSGGPVGVLPGQLQVRERGCRLHARHRGALVVAFGVRADRVHRRDPRSRRAARGPALVWKPDVRPALEGTAADPAEFRRQFLLDFGSHYVSAISYGYRLAIRGRITTTESSAAQSVRAAFKTAFLGGGAGGSVEDDARKALSRSDVELTFVATSGGLMHEGERRPGILTKLDDIIATLADLRSGAMTILGAPLGASVRTYWNLLPAEYALSRALLQDHGEPPPPEGFFGVPVGTIVVWHPTERAIYTDGTGQRHLVPPTGWALCDGTSGTPDLRDRFVRGTLEVGTIGSAAGSPTHTHTASTDKTTGTYDSHAGIGATLHRPKKDHTHAVKVSAAAVDPPHVKFAFIMKL